MSRTIEQLSYSVPAWAAATASPPSPPRLRRSRASHPVDDDLNTKRVAVEGAELDGELDGAAVRGAIDEAGYDVA